ncbi:hypothetical protein D1872_181410 [compost metagenome]
MIDKGLLLQRVDQEILTSSVRVNRRAFKDLKALIEAGAYDIEIPADKLRLAYDRASVDGSLGVVWHDAAKEAYQDGLLTALEILNIKVKGLNN